ncbi:MULTISPECIES: hypothetical protein [Moorena]|uniref:glycosyltransferase n=1 Tax=Moorena TaxID=1155738 RepID=UPI0005CA27FF|nr:MULTISPECIES: hypothetical protein [Moorena]NEP35290.1 hypothetical protein [Moorena sp. SIO3B2]NEP65574.1 hypothetical protein [Moorena sp. SIO3A5]NER85555.1 hypothetical protein [Moorena sp. SIO3A2]NES42980.1 hypothetical protein [Moorena sp. SIO2C4]OLT65080.1 hypothetical protein BI334_08575 [Moorena producens 3L]
MELLSKYPPATAGKIIVWGLLASYPFGGMTWQVLHYLAGLRRLGFDVWYVEDSDSPLQDPKTLWHTPNYTENVKYLSLYMNSLGMGERWIFRPPSEQNVCLGAADSDGLQRLYREADAVINLCGAHYLRPEHSEINCLIYLQTDPFVDQVRVAQNESWLIGQLDSYNHLFTYGYNLGKDDCLVPVERYQWHPTRPPVCIDWWSNVSSLEVDAKLTTISTWKNLKKDIVWQNENYSWRKDSEFRRFIDLPLHSHFPIELALEGISESEAAKMRHYGWQIISARNLTNPSTYRQYICSSLGEFTVTKEQYVRPRTGWFSDRSVCYLAAGRPVITQETGFSKFLPTGKGLFAFQTMEDILKAMDSIKSDYEGNCRAARDIATEYFAAEKVISRLMENAGF